MIYVLTGFTVFFIVCNISVQIMMTAYLRKRGYSVNIWLIRLYILRYIRQYREATIKEHGKTGPLFFAFIASLVLLVPFLISVLVLLVI